MDQHIDLPLVPKHKSHHMKALSQLSKTSGLYPECLTLKGVKREKIPAGWGSYGDVYRGQWDGKLIAVKVMRMHQHLDVVRCFKVGLNY
jgi:hypothetical protein